MAVWLLGIILSISVEVRGQIWRPDNLAFRQPVGAANDFPDNAYPPEYAVDGDREMRHARSSCALIKAGAEVVWWYVDLEAQRRIRQVLFVNGETAANLARQFSINVAREIDTSAMLYNDYSRCSEQHESLRPGEVKAYSCLELCIGRYVVLLKTTKENLQICELEVYDINSFGNIALGQPAITYTQFKGDSIYEGFVYAGRAVDGHTNSNDKDDSCLQTSNRADISEEWLSVDLGEEMRIRRVTVINRGDGFGYMFAKFRIRVTSDFHPWMFEKNQFLECFHQTDALVEGEIKHINCDYIAVGQYVLTFKYDAQSAGLLLCEMEIEATGLETNLALEKPTLMSGEKAASERLSYRAVDGIVRGQRAAISCIVTPGREHVEWFMVDLLEVYRVRNVVVVTPGEQGACVKPMGMTAKKPEIKDEQITASSFDGLLGPRRGRFFNRPGNVLTASWCAKPPGSTDDWIQTRFPKDVIITGVTIQGGHGKKYTTSYRVSYSTDGFNFTFLQERGKDAVFKGTFDGYNKARTAWFNQEIRLKYIRIYPLTWNIAACLRYELHGCYQLALKLEKFRIMVSRRFDGDKYSENKFTQCYQQDAPLPTSSYRPIYCSREVVGRYVVVEKTDSIGAPLNFCELEVYGTQHNGNIAFGMKTRQRETVGPATSDLAVDGVTDPDQQRSKSCAHSRGLSWLRGEKNWFMVDLASEVDIGEVIIVNALDCRDSCLKNLSVVVATEFNATTPGKGGEPCGSHYSNTVGGEGITLRCQEGAVGRYVILTVPIRQDLRVCEVEVYERYRYSNNLALGRPTYQSTSSGGRYGHSYLAVDGARYGNYHQGSCSMTCADSKDAWWAVQLDQMYQVRKVMIANRLDCCAERLNMFSVIVAQGFIPYGLNKIPTALCFMQTAPLKSGETRTLYCQNKPRGDHVIIVKADAFQEPLTLCEVLVFGQPLMESLLTNKPTYQSSDQSKPSSWKAVDGDLSPNYFDGSCSSTLGTWMSDWWAVDMEKTYSMHRVVVSNRVDCCTDGLRDYVVTLSEELFPKDPNDNAPANHVCSDRRSPEFAGGDTIPLTCQGSSRGRFLTIYKEGTTEESPLILCEVEAFGKVSRVTSDAINLELVDLKTERNTTNLALIVDQNLSTEKSKCVKIHNSGSYAWFSVDLGFLPKIFTVSILLPGFNVIDPMNVTVALLPLSTDVSTWLNSYSVFSPALTTCGTFYARPFRGQYVNFDCRGLASQMILLFSVEDFSVCELLVHKSG